MTMPTSRLTPQLFPDQYVAMNRYGFRPPVPSNLRVAPEQGILPAGETARAQVSFAQQEKAKVLNRLQTNHLKDLGMRGHLDTTERSQRYTRPASRSAVPNGIFHLSTNRTATSTGLQGGVITSREGLSWTRQRLAQRVGEYNARKASNFMSEESFPQSGKITMPPTIALEGLFVTMFDALQEGAIGGELIDAARKIESLILSPLGAGMSPPEIMGFIRMLEQLRPAFQTVRTAQARYSQSAEKKRTIQVVAKIMRRIETVMKNLNKISYGSPQERLMYINAERARILPEVAGQFRPAGQAPGVGVQVGGEEQ
jgi:hypothetical protein